MDRDNYRDLGLMAPDSERAEKIHMLREFDPQGGKSASVPDPYYGYGASFDEVFDLIERSCQGLLRFLEQGQSGGVMEILAPS
jgi:protein-tyrosine phosphatase